MYKDILSEISKKYDKVVVEIGSGNGVSLINILEYYDKKKTFFIGIEIDDVQYFKACEKMKKKRLNNIQFIKEPFENFFSEIKSDSIDTVISILPHPDYIDKNNQKMWVPKYKKVLKKIKKNGYFILVTELIDELLEPVTVEKYQEWRKWLIETFRYIGFKIIKIIDNGKPSYLSSHYLNKFRNDPQRIKIISLIMLKV
ncbi:MAG TPA: class I SAM-dependent methyltransferase [Candidatus Nitrosocosmicus sp.]